MTLAKKLRQNLDTQIRRLPQWLMFTNNIIATR